MNTERPVKSEFIKELNKRFTAEMPRILKEVSLYEVHLKNGKLNSNPTVAPQFNR